MNKRYILLLSGLFSVSLSAQKSVISEGAESITIAELRDHMFYLASDDADKIECDFFQRSCRLIYEIIIELANGDDNLKE